MPIRVRHLGPVGTDPTEILRPPLDRWLAAKEVPTPQDRVSLAEMEALSSERQQLTAPIVEVPVYPRSFVVLRVRIVVPVLRARDLIAVREHRHALGKRERRDERAHQAISDVENFRIVRLA